MTNFLQCRTKYILCHKLQNMLAQLNPKAKENEETNPAFVVRSAIAPWTFSRTCRLLSCTSLLYSKTCPYNESDLVHKC